VSPRDEIYPVRPLSGAIYFFYFFFNFELERPSRRDLSLSEKMESVRRPAGAISFLFLF
jgi:hypothetical protein